MQWNCANCGESATVASPLAAGQEPCPHCGKNLVEVELPPPVESVEEQVVAPPPSELPLSRSVVGKIVGSITGGLLGGLCIPILAQLNDPSVNDYICILSGAFGGGCVGGMFGLGMDQNPGPKKIRDMGGPKNLASENRTRLLVSIVIGALLGSKLGTYLGKPSPISTLMGTVGGLLVGAMLGSECGIIVGEALEPAPQTRRRVVGPLEDTEDGPEPAE